MMDEKPETTWIQQAKKRGYSDTLHLVLDVLEPVSPLAAQLLWIAQPAARLFGANTMIKDLAQAFETPGGIDSLRHQLDDSERQ